MGESFSRNVPTVFLNEISKGAASFRIHLEDFKNLSYLLELVGNSMPGDYRAKCGHRVDNASMVLCKVRYVDGLVENVTLYLDRQLGEVIYTTLGGAYRSSAINLRHMLQLTCQATQAVVNKRYLTRSDSDEMKSMSIEDFEEFLGRNQESIESKRLRLAQMKGNGRDTTVEGLTLFGIPEDMMPSIECSKMTGRFAAKALYSQLSTYAHAGMWERVDITEEEEFFPRHTREGFHSSLALIFETLDMILPLLLVTGFEEVSFYSKSRADDFIESCAKGFVGVDRPRLPNTSATLAKMRNRFTSDEITSDRERLQTEDEAIENRKIVCSDCETPLYGDEKVCPMCGMKNPCVRNDESNQDDL